MATYEAAHGTECQYPSGCGTEKDAVHHVINGKNGFTGDLCGFHSPFDVKQYEDIEPEYREDEPKVKYAEGFVFVNVYELDRVKGGDEEGEWYFTTGTLITSRQVSAMESIHVAAELRVKYPDAPTYNAIQFAKWEAEGGEGRPPRKQYRYWEVNYRGGDYEVVVEDHPGADYPEHTPHYE